MATVRISDWTGIIGIALGAFALGFHFSERPPKIAYAESTTLMSQFSEAIKARKKFETLSGEWDKNIQALKDSLDTALERLKLEYEKASPSKKDEIRALLEKRNEDLQKYTNAVKKMSDAKESELMSPVVGQLNAFLKTWGKQHGYALILGTSAGGNILQADPDLDVTASLLKELNEYYRDLPVADNAKAPVVDTAKMKQESKP